MLDSGLANPGGEPARHDSGKNTWVVLWAALHHGGLV